MNENYYSILNCTQNSSLVEIKRNYQQLAKIYHPDKQTQLHTSDKFMKIDEAWKTLRDEKLRKVYDSILMEKKFKEQHLVYQTVNCNELSFHNNLAYYPCRCGNSYVIDRNGIQNNEYIECEECSYVIIIIKEE